MQQADHSFAVLHMHNYLCWESTLASWAWTNAQGRALVTATRVNTVLLQCEPMPGSVQSPAAEQSMLSKWRRTSLADNIARQKITISWEVLKFPHFFLFRCRNVAVGFLHPRWLTKQLRITELPRGQFLDCHQVPENCHVRLCVTLDPWLLSASVRLISHFHWLRLLTKGAQCHLTCVVNISGPAKWDF